jgi:hypothetical protein
MLNTAPTIRADLIGHATASACGLVAHSGSPVIALCRRLVDAGHDPESSLEAYRGATLCLTVRSIGEAANLQSASERSTLRMRMRQFTDDFLLECCSDIAG